MNDANNINTANQNLNINDMIFAIDQNTNKIYGAKITELFESENSMNIEWQYSICANIYKQTSKIKNNNVIGKFGVYLNSNENQNVKIYVGNHQNGYKSFFECTFNSYCSDEQHEHCLKVQRISNRHKVVEFHAKLEHLYLEINQINNELVDEKNDRPAKRFRPNSTDVSPAI